VELLEDRVVPSLFATAHDGSELISINPTTGAATVVGTYPPGNANIAYEDAFTPDGTLWTFVGYYSPVQLEKVDTTTGTLTPVGGPATIPGLIRGLQSDSAGNLYADTLDGSFYSVNLSTGQLSLIGSFGFPGVNFLDMARDSSGNFYVVGAVSVGTSYQNYLFQVNLSTGQATPLVQIAGTTDPVGGLMIDPATNTFYITNYNSNPSLSELFQLNPVTGAVTPIGTGLGVNLVAGGDFTPAANQPPVANAGGLYSIFEGQGVTLYASASHDPDGDPLSYSWTINGQANAASGVSPTLTWSQLAALGVNDTGNFSVSVQVNDGHGNTTTASSSLTVYETAPTVSISGASSVNEGDTYSLTLSYLDPSPVDPAASWTINWGDGSAPQTVAGSPAAVFHRFADGPNSYTITAMVTSDDGTYVAANGVNVFVANVEPTNVILTPSASSINEGDSISLTGSFTDPGVLDTHTVVINWGDNSPNTTLHLAAGVLTFSAGSHQYLNNLPGNAAYAITATVTDKDNGSGVGATSVVVNNVAPIAQITGFTQPNPLFILQGDVLTFSGAFSDPGVLDSHTVNWNFGDLGSSSVSFGPGGSAGFTANHAYAAPGTYTVTLTVTDSDGGFSTAQTTVVVDTPAQATAAIIPYVQSLSDLNAGQKNSLTGMLNSLIAFLNRGKMTAAGNQVKAFDNQVNALFSSGSLTQAEANLLVSSADAIRRVIS
jgi:hypothetical protein